VLNSVAEDEHGQKVADQKQQPMSLLLKNTLDVIYKTSAFEDCQKIAMHYLDKASKRVEAVLKTKHTDHLKSRKCNDSCNFHLFFISL
jgi:S-ribosylhomocysteine lyase LuxS involved in autoinducer biosynthesis